MSSLNANGSAYANIVGPSGDLTLCGWFRVNAWTGNEYQIMIYIQPGSGSGDLGFEAHTTVDQILAYFWDGGDVEVMEYFPDAAPTTWVYGAISISATIGKIRLLRTGETTFTTHTFDLTNWGAGSRTIWVFNDPYAEQCEDVDGTRIRVFAGELSDSDLLAEAQSDTPVLTPWASYPFTSVTNWGNDVSGNNRHLSSNGTPVLEADQPTDIGSGANEDELTPNDLSLIPELDAPALTQKHVFNANELIFSVALDSPALTQKHVLSANNISVIIALDEPALSTLGFDVLTPNDLALAVSLDAPALTQKHSLSANDLGLGVELDAPALGQKHSFLGNSISTTIELDAPALSIQHASLKIFIAGSSVINGRIGMDIWSDYAAGRSLGLGAVRDDCEVINTAEDGRPIADMIAFYESEILAHKDPSKRNIIIAYEFNNSLWGGGIGDPPVPNGLSPEDAMEEAEAYTLNAQSDGFEVLWCTMCPIDYEPEQVLFDEVNILLRASTVFDGLIETDTIEEFYPPGWLVNEHYVDDVHINDSGQQIITNFISGFLDSYLEPGVDNLTANDLSVGIQLDSPALSDAPFAPEQIVSIVGRWAADDISGSSAATWVDRSTHGNDLAQATSGVQLAVVSNDADFNGHKSVQGASGDNISRATYTQGSITQPFTLYAVIKLSPTWVTQQAIVSSANESNRADLWVRNNGELGAATGPGGLNVTGVAAGARGILRGIFDGSTSHVRWTPFSGSEASASGSLGANAGIGITIGSYATGTNNFTGKIADVLSIGEDIRDNADPELDAKIMAYLLREYRPPHALVANNLTVSFNLDTPALGQIHSLSANEINTSVALDSPALGQVHALSAQEFALSVELDSPSLRQVYALSANELAISIEMDSPGLGTEGVHALSADELNLAVALDAPALGQVHALSADDLNLATGLDSPALGQVHSLDVNALTLSTGLDSPALNIIHALGANDLVISVLLGSPELSTSTHVLVATDLILSAALASPALGQIHSLSADDLNISIWLDSAALGFGGTDRIFAVTYVHEPGQKLSYTWSRNQ